jgi:hypothetical protein
LSAAGLLACSSGSSAPLAPSATGAVRSIDSATSGAARVKARKPVALSPVGGGVVNDLTPDLTAQNATGSFVSGLTFTYVFRVWNEQGELVYTSNAVEQGSGDTTTHEVDADLDFNKPHTWAVQAFLGANEGPASDTADFRTMDLPNHFRCGPPFNHSPVAIIQCHRDMFPLLRDEQVPIMLKRIARDFNRAGVEGGPFGALWKLKDNNCHGYSCDVICSGQGDEQNQWDILIDETFAVWGSDIVGIRVDHCEIQPSELEEVSFQGPNGLIPFEP